MTHALLGSADLGILTGKIPPESAMDTLATTTLSSKGQVVIPENLRIALGLEPGTRFVVIGERDTLMLKVITPPKRNEFDRLLLRARRAAAAAGLRRKDVAKAIRDVRRRK